MNNIMLDLETMGTQSNAAIASIGAVYFDNNGLGEEFYSVVDFQSCLNIGLQVEASTIEWWMFQSDDAKRIFNKSEHFGIEAALTGFNLFTPNDNNFLIWGNGSDFDNVILKNAYKTFGRVVPWEYHQNRCFRTFKNLYQDVKPPKNVGTHHNALDDAKWQAEYAVKIAKEKNIQL